jgi:hypothetical protein
VRRSTFFSTGLYAPPPKRRFCLVHEAEREQLGGFELGGERRFGARGFALREVARHAHHLQRLVLQVVRLFRVQREDAVGKRLVGGDQHGELLEAEHLRGRQSMAPVRRPETTVLAPHDDERIEEGGGRLDRSRKTLGVCRRQIALEGCRLHGAERQ